MLASIGKPREAVRASLVHVFFNLIGVLLWVGFIDQLAQLVTRVSPVAAGLSGAEKLAAETPRQIANAHTIFNIANTLILLPFGALLARLVEYILPDRAAEESEVPVGRRWTEMHLYPDLLAVPSMALEQTRGEIRRMAGVVRSMVEDIMGAFVSGDMETAGKVTKREEEVDYLGEQINDFLVSISRRNLSQEQTEFATQLMDVTDYLEHISDLVKKDLGVLLNKKAEAQVAFSAEGREELLALHRSVLNSFDLAVQAFDENDAEAAHGVVRAKADPGAAAARSRLTHYERLRQQRQESLESSVIHLDLIDYLRRIYSYVEGIAFTMLEGYLDTRRDARREVQETAAHLSQP